MAGGESDIRESLSVHIKKLAWLTVPLTAQLIVTMLNQLVDTAMVGHIEPNGPMLAAMSISLQLWFVFEVARVGLGIGIVAVTARAIGAGNKQQVQRFVAQSTLLGLGCRGTVAADQPWCKQP